MPSAKYEWTSKKPSVVMLRKSIKEGIREGADFIVLTWGENEIRLEKHERWVGFNGPWTGDGWIGKHGGSDMADALNKETKRDTCGTPF